MNGGGGGTGRTLRDIGLAAGLGTLASASPYARAGVHTGLSVFNLLDQNRRRRRVSDILAKHYGVDEPGGQIAGPGNQGDPAFGGQVPTVRLGLTDEPSRKTYTADLEQLFGPRGEEMAAPGMFEGAPRPTARFSEMMKTRRQAMERDPRRGVMGALAEAGELTPEMALQHETVMGRERRAEQRYGAQMAQRERMHAETLGVRKDEYARQAALDTTKERRDVARHEAYMEKHRADLEAQKSRLSTQQAAEARRAAALELAKARFEVWKNKQEEGKEVTASDMRALLDVQEAVIEDLEGQLIQDEYGAGELSETDREDLQKELSDVKTQRAELLRAYQAMLETRVGGAETPSAQPPATAAGDTTGAAYPLVSSHGGSKKRLVYGRDIY